MRSALRTPASGGSSSSGRFGDIIIDSGDVAQLGERRVRNAKVEGSIPFRSTISPSAPAPP